MQHFYAEFFPIVTVVVDEVSDLLECLECDGMLKGGKWGVDVEIFPVVAIVADKVGDWELKNCIEPRNTPLKQILFNVDFSKEI